MGFKVKITKGTGHDIDDEDPDDPEFVEFETKAERDAFFRGVNMAYEAMFGWTDGWISAEPV